MVFLIEMSYRAIWSCLWAWQLNCVLCKWQKISWWVELLSAFSWVARTCNSFSFYCWFFACVACVCRIQYCQCNPYFNPLTPDKDYSGRTAPLTSKRCILYIYSTNIGTEYFKHGIYSLFFPLQNAVCFIILTYLVPILFTFYIQGVLKFKKIIPAPKG